MKRLTATSLIFAFALLVILAAVFALSCGQNVAYADTVHTFLISSEDGNLWNIYFDGGYLQSADGNFFNYSDPDSDYPATIFKQVIDAKVASLPVEDRTYQITFDIPAPIAYFVDGIDQNPYTEENNSMIYAKTDYVGPLPGLSLELEYRPLGEGEFARFDTTGTRTFRFGTSVAKGDYELRIKAGVRFTYYGTEYTATKASNVIVCHITDSAFPEESLAEVKETLGVVELEYGATLEEIAEYASTLTRAGDWTVWSGQDAAYVYPANENERTIYLDFHSVNVNYDVSEKVPVPVVVRQRRLDVWVETVEVLVGHPLVTEFSYNKDEVESRLVGEDTLASIGFKIAAQNVNINVPGTYQIKATSTNNNYEIITRTPETQHLLAGIYRIHSNGIIAHGDDFRNVTIVRPEGVIGLHFEVVRGEEFEGFDGLTLISAYRLIVTDGDGNEIENLGELTVTLEKFPEDYAVAYFDGEQWQVVLLDDSMSFILPNGIRTFAVYGKTPAPYGKTVDWNGGLTAICVLIMLFVVGTWIVASVYNLKRRILK